MDPKPTERFNAFTVSHNSPHRCNPFICTGKDYAYIYAEDEEEPVTRWIFRISKFRFELVDDTEN